MYDPWYRRTVGPRMSEGRTDLPRLQIDTLVENEDGRAVDLHAFGYGFDRPRDLQVRELPERRLRCGLLSHGPIDSSAAASSRRTQEAKARSSCRPACWCRRTTSQAGSAPRRHEDLGT